MNAGMLTLIGSLVGAGPQAPARPVGVMPAPGMAAPAAPPVMMPPPHPGLPCPAPLLAARVIAPQGVRFTLLPGSPAARMFEGPVVFGLRPGYVYRLELTNLPYQPGRSL